jgi:2-keto-4-pentenoate hydratase/2-oxohepta-3-ene-1,7-dioic acid hydratase in catechol pathway
MKLLRYGPAGQERPGVLDEAGNIRDLSSIVADIDKDSISPSGLAALQHVDIDSLPVVDGAQRFGVPVAGVGKFIAIGLNYSDHAKEAGMAVPSEPVVFMKAISCLAGANDDVVKPRKSTKLDWEVELGIVIGTMARSVSEEDALDHIAGYCVVNDVSEREYQLERGGTWDKGKSFDTFGPAGPYLVTADEIGDVHALSMWLDVNGVRMQQGNTQTMIFRCAQLVSYVSEVMTLMPGDIITTGTPPGVGMGKQPPQFLNVDDVVTLGVEGLGEQRQRIVAFRA